LAFNRTTDGRLAADGARFPHGMAWLAEQLHARGLKLGLYAAASLLTCRDFPGSQGHEELDAATFAGWGADLVKLDSCGGVLADGSEAWVHQYSRWSAALNASGRQIVFSCSWPFYYARCVAERGPAACGIDPAVHALAAEICHFWRYDFDLEPTWTGSPGGIKELLAKAATDGYTATLRGITGHGAYNDLDFIVSGCPLQGPCEPGGSHPLPPLSRLEQRTQFSMWCLLASPLIIGSDVRGLDAFALQTLSNPHAIAISQDPLAAQPRVVSGNFSAGSVQAGAWARAMANGDSAVALLNLGDAPTIVRVPLAALGLAGTGARVFDVWTGVAVNCTAAEYAAAVAPHEALLLRLSPLGRP